MARRKKLQVEEKKDDGSRQQDIIPNIKRD